MIKSKLQSGRVKLPNGETLNVAVNGSGQDAIILIHGMWFDHRSMDQLVPYLSERFTIISPDFRGHGLSSYEKPIQTINDYIEDLSLLIEYYGLKKVSFLGWCGGSSIALQYASMYPDKVDKIVASSPPGLDGFPYSKKGKNGEKIPIESKEDLINHIGLNLLNKAFQVKDRKGLAATIERSIFNTKVPEPEVIDSLVDQILLANNILDVAWVAYTSNLTDRRNSVTEGSGAILKVKAKILLFYGEDDGVIPRFAIDEYKKYLGDQVTLKLFKDGGHAVHLLYPSEVAQGTIEFFEK